MLHRIVIASDSFKGSVSSREVADAVTRAVARVFPACEVVTAAVADGGEGTVDALVSNLGGGYAEVCVHDPLMRPVEAVYGIADDGATAIVEMAAASGLTLLAAGERNPLETTTYGTGELIRDALERGCRRFLIGIGGSATNDAGMGMLRALGARFLDGGGRELAGVGRDLGAVAAVDMSGLMPQLREARFRVACDVDNPLYGPAGAACVFARQKGADDAAVAQLDAGLRHFAGVVQRETGVDMQSVAGAGAGGGIGGAFAALLGAELVSGIDMVLDATGFDAMISGADLIITGEGRIDSQTAMGKAPDGVLRRARRQGIPVVALCGSVGDGTFGSDFPDNGFAAVMPVVHAPVTLAQAMDKDTTCSNIERTAYQLLRLIETFDRT